MRRCNIGCTSSPKSYLSAQEVFCSVASLQPGLRFQAHLRQLLESAAPQAAYVPYLAAIFGASEGGASTSPAVQVLP